LKDQLNWPTGGTDREATVRQSRTPRPSQRPRSARMAALGHAGGADVARRARNIPRWDDPCRARY